MRCQDARQQIFVYLDGELNPNDEHDLYKHLAACHDCSEYLDAARETNRQLERCLLPINPPEGFAEAVMMQIDGYEAVEVQAVLSDGTDPEHRGIFQRLGGSLRYTVAVASITILLIAGGMSAKGNDYFGALLAKQGWLGSTMTVDGRDGVSGARGSQSEDLLAHRADLNQNSGENEGAGTVSGASGDQGNLLPNEQEGETDTPGAVSGLDLMKGVQGEYFAAAGLGGEGVSVEVTPAATVILTPLAVNDDFDSVRPFWAGKDKAYYLSGGNAPGGSSFLVWETDLNGTRRRMVGPNDYGISLNHGGGVWSPDGKMIAFVTDKNGYWEVWSSNLQGQLTNLSISSTAEDITPAKGDMWAYNPVWASTGEVAFLTQRFENVDIMAVDIYGNLRVLTKTPEQEAFPVWSPDGKRLAYFRPSAEDGQGRIYVADKNGSSPQPVTPGVPGGTLVPAWSPSGQRLGINVSSNGMDSNGVWVAGADGGSWARVSDVGGGRVISWAPDGRKLAFTNAAGELFILKFAGVRGEGSNLIQVTSSENSGPVQDVRWSPDSKQLLLEWKRSRAGTRGIYLAELQNVSQETD